MKRIKGSLIDGFRSLMRVELKMRDSRSKNYTVLSNNQSDDCIGGDDGEIINKNGNKDDWYSFDIVKEVPEAFECPSGRLQDRRRDNLYYRYHGHSYYDLHVYLIRKMIFSDTDVTNKDRQ